MSKRLNYDAVIVGSGPNGLSAGITLAREGLSVAVFEAKNIIGGGLSSSELTLPGFIHDNCSAIHPLGIASPFFRQLPLDKYGLEWIHPLAPLAHPFEDGTAALLERSIDATSFTLGVDAKAYCQLMAPIVANWDKLEKDLLAPFHIPKHPLAVGQFALHAVQPAHYFVQKKFQSDQAQAFFGGLAAHSILPLDRFLTTAFGLVLGTLGHTAGWPFPRGGSQKFANALGAYFQSLGGEIYTGIKIQKMSDLPNAQVILFDLTPRQVLSIANHLLPDSYTRKLEKYRYGPGVCKVDWALNHPIPWKAKECLRGGTVHIGGSFKEIVKSENEVWEGRHPEKPFMLIAQQSLFDSSRAPEGKQTVWGYCHVPNNSSFDMTDRMESQIERFAPGFRDCIMAKATRLAHQFEHFNANCIGGDINGGVQDIYQFFTRPVARMVPYSIPSKGLYICSSSTPPGGGVHGMCGYWAARAALKEFLN